MIGLTACHEAAPERKVRYTWLNDGRRACSPDTLTMLPKHTERDSMLGRVEFTYCEGRHVVTSWTDDHYAPVDGGSFWLELDSLGKVYRYSTTWPGFEIVRSTNDSINDLILMAMGAASLPGRFGLQRPSPPEPKIETVQFIAIEQEEEPD